MISIADKLSSVIKLYGWEIDDIVNRDAPYNESTEQYDWNYLNFQEKLKYYKSLDVNNLTDEEVKRIESAYEYLGSRW